MLRRLLSFLLLVLACGAQAEAPHDVVHRFLQAFNRRDLPAAAQLVQGGKVTAEARRFLQQQRLPVFQGSDYASTVSATRATVFLRVRIDGRSQDDRVGLVKSGQSWLIVPNKNMAGDVIASLASVFGDPSVFRTAKQASVATHCMSNMKQVVTACLILAADYDDVLKVTETNWRQQALRYLKNKQLFLCPLVKSPTSYAFNRNLANRSLATLKNPTLTVMVYEGKNGVLDFRHNGKCVVGYADGHVKQITRQQAKTLLWK